MIEKDDTQEYLDEIYELVRENNKLLKKERRARVYAGIAKLVWTVVVIGVPVWLYFTYLAPMIDNLQATTAQLEGLMKVNPQLQEKVGPITETMKTLMQLFNVSK